ncbi:MAG: pantoate--beta-alanine ligase, partial [Novosphingobium sp.]|nr:pantoate--beta-alanine ligase [Novosphingobium sp.]
AMSSRNAYLSPEERKNAVALPNAMREAIAAMSSGTSPGTALTALEEALLSSGFASVDYAEVRDADTLDLLSSLAATPARLLVAARIGKARLIDNMAISPA